MDRDLMEQDMPDPIEEADADSMYDNGRDNYSAGDGLPGVPVEGWPGVRAGAFASGSGLLGILRVNQPAKPVAYDPTAAGCPGPYDSRIMEITGYTSGPESTGKAPGDKGYGQGRYGPVGPGAMAADPAVVGGHTQVYVPGYGLGAIQDTGRLIKGDRLDLWFPTVDQARAWGRRTVPVEICRPNTAKPPRS